MQKHNRKYKKKHNPEYNFFRTQGTIQSVPFPTPLVGSRVKRGSQHPNHQKFRTVPIGGFPGHLIFGYFGGGKTPLNKPYPYSLYRYLKCLVM